VKTNTNDFTPYRTDNNGTSWTAKTTLTRTGIVEWAGINCDIWGFHWVYRVNESSTDKVYFRYYDFATETWYPEQLAFSAANGGVAGAVYTGIDFTIVNVPIYGTTWIMIAVGSIQGGVNRGIAIWSAVGYTPNIGSVLASQTIGYGWPESGTGHISPSIDIEWLKGSDGKTSANPNAWISFGRSSAWRMKFIWNGNGWNPNYTMVQSNGLASSVDNIPGRWDGTRFIQTIINPGNTQTVACYEMNASNGWIDNQRFTPSHPQGVIRQQTLSINASTQDFRVYAVGTSNDTIYYTEYTRQSATFSAWTQVSATAVLQSGSEFGVRKSNYGNSRFDIYLGSTNLQTHISHLYNSAPNGGVWVLPNNGDAQDVGQQLRLDWNFSDPNAGDTQSAYALSRQIGAGALNYWRASDSTWQVAEVQNTSGTTIVTLASAWALASDANYTFKVKVWDSSSVAGPYGSGLIVIPSTPVNPAITAPTASQVLSTNQVSVTWTATEQSAYRVGLFASTPVANINLNPYFETDVSDFSGTNGATVSRDTGFFHQGIASMKVLPDGVTAFPQVQSSLYPCVAGTLYRHRAWIRGNGSSITLRFRYYDSSQNALGVDDDQAQSPTAGTWTLYQVITTVPPGAAYGRLIAFCSVTASTSWFMDEWTFDIPTFDTGYKAETNPVTRAYEPSTILPDATSWTVALVTKNNEGLQSAEQQDDFSISYIPPSTPNLTATPMSSLGLIRITTNNPFSAGAPGTFVNAGTAVNGNNVSLSPGTPASIQKEDLLLVFASIRSSGTGTVNLPAGWVDVVNFGNTRIFARFAQLSGDAPTVTFTGGASGDDTIAQMVAFRGFSYSAATNATVLNTSAQNVAYPSLTIPTNNQLAIIAGWKQDQWTSVATPGGFSLIGSLASAAGNKSSDTWDYVIQTAHANITGASWTVTGGVSAISRGLTLAFNVKPALLYQDIYRRVVGDTSNGLRIATGLAGGVTFDDFNAVSGVNYEYRQNAIGVNGTSVYGAWTQ
jgi:hypothetical protein